MVHFDKVPTREVQGMMTETKNNHGKKTRQRVRYDVAENHRNFRGIRLQKPVTDRISHSYGIFCISITRVFVVDVTFFWREDVAVWGRETLIIFGGLRLGNCLLYEIAHFDIWGFNMIFYTRPRVAPHRLNHDEPELWYNDRHVGVDL